MDFQNRLKTVFERLDQDLQHEETERHLTGALSLGVVEVKIMGQSALILADLPFPLAGTMDLDAAIQGDFWVQKKLGEFLIEEGIRLETDAHLIWMPEETLYQPWKVSHLLRILIAEPDAVIASKAKFKRPKDKELIRLYLESFPNSKEKLKRWNISTDWISR